MVYSDSTENDGNIISKTFNLVIKISHFQLNQCVINLVINCLINWKEIVITKL